MVVCAMLLTKVSNVYNFRKHESTITAVVSFIKSIIEFIDNKDEKVCAVFMDL